MSNFESTIQKIYGEKGTAWLITLPRLVAAVASRLALRDLKPVSNLTYNYVLSGFQGDTPIVLKLSLDNEGLQKEACALRCFAGFGAVGVIAEEEVYDEALATAGRLLLLEQAIPGTSLKKYFPAHDQEAIAITSTVMTRLHHAGIPEHHRFPHIKDWLSILDRHWDVPAGYVQKARILRDQLLASSGPDVLLHGDLHHDNILYHGDSFVVIDPKGVIGETVYEVSAFICNPLPELCGYENAINLIQNRITAFALALKVPPGRIADWCFVKALLSLVWTLEDNGDVAYWMQMLKVLDR